MKDLFLFLSLSCSLCYSAYQVSEILMSVTAYTTLWKAFPHWITDFFSQIINPFQSHVHVMLFTFIINSSVPARWETGRDGNQNPSLLCTKILTGFFSCFSASPKRLSGSVILIWNWVDHISCLGKILGGRRHSGILVVRGGIVTRRFCWEVSQFESRPCVHVAGSLYWEVWKGRRMNWNKISTWQLLAMRNGC